MQSKDLNFSYAIQVDLDDLITNIFWADGRMKLDYEYLFALYFFFFFIQYKTIEQFCV